MANDYFQHSANRVSEGVIARASQINNIADEVAAGFEKLPAQAIVKAGLNEYVTAAGVANVYTVTSANPPASYTEAEGRVYNVKFPVTNTGASTLNLDGLGVKNIKRNDGTDPIAGDLTGIVQVMYDGTNFVLVNALPNLVAQVTALDASAAAHKDAAAVSAGESAASAVEAATSKSDAALSASAALNAANNIQNAALWVSGSTYTVGKVVYSPLNYQNYRAKTSHSGLTTDPRDDLSNWEPLGGTSNGKLFYFGNT